MVSRQAAVGRAERPTIRTLHYPRGPTADHRLNCQHQAFGQHIPLEWIVAIRYGRFLVNRSADPVPRKPFDYRKAATPYLAFDRTPNLIDPHACTRHSQGSLKRRRGTRD